MFYRPKIKSLLLFFQELVKIQVPWKQIEGQEFYEMDHNIVTKGPSVVLPQRTATFS